MHRWTARQHNQNIMAITYNHSHAKKENKKEIMSSTYDLDRKSES